MSRTTNDFFVDDQVRATGLASGSIPTQVGTFTDAKTAIVGTLKTATLNGGTYTLKGDITSGNLIVPSSATTLPSVNTETILIVVNNPKLLKLVGLSPKFLAPGKSKFLLVLVNNQSLLNYVESKSSEVEDSDPVSLGNSNAADKLVFVNLQKKNLYYFSEVSYQALLTAIANSSNSSNNTSNNSSNNTSNNSSNNTSNNSSNNTSNNSSNNTSNNSSNNTSNNSSNNTSTNTSINTSTQVVRVVFVGLPSRLIPGFGTVVKVERRNSRDDDD